MSLYHKDYATAAEVTLETRAAAIARLSESNVASFLPDSYEETETFALNVNDDRAAASAVYRAFDTEAPFGSEANLYSLSGHLPPISQKMRIRETGVRSGSAAVTADVMEKAKNNGVAIATRSILARGEVLETGKLTIQDENRLTFTVDFERPSNHEVSAATLWSDPDADVLGDLLAWKETYRATNGTDPATVVVSSDVMAALTRNLAIVNVAAPGVTTSIVNPDAVRAVLGSWGFTNIVVNDELARDNTGASRRVISSNKVIFLPGDQSPLSGTSLGRTIWGVPSEATNPEYGIGGEVAGLFGAVYHQTDPEGLFVLGSALVMPVLSNARATLAATVLAP